MLRPARGRPEPQLPTGEPPTLLVLPAVSLQRISRPRGRGYGKTATASSIRIRDGKAPSPFQSRPRCQVSQPPCLGRQNSRDGRGRKVQAARPIPCDADNAGRGSSKVGRNSSTFVIARLSDSRTTANPGWWAERSEPNSVERPGAFHSTHLLCDRHLQVHKSFPELLHAGGQSSNSVARTIFTSAPPQSLGTRT